MPNLKRKYQGDKEVVVYRIIEEDGRIGTYAVGRAKNPDSIPNFLARVQFGEYKGVEVIRLFKGINETGIATIKGALAHAVSHGAEITPSDLERDLCERE